MPAKKRYRRERPYDPRDAMRDIANMSKMAMAGTVGIGMLGMAGSIVTGLVKK